jgi:hypothetical protein
MSRFDDGDVVWAMSGSHVATRISAEAKQTSP